jgi:F-type H+-transporting ATPase subunit b
VRHDLRITLIGLVAAAAAAFPASAAAAGPAGGEGSAAHGSAAEAHGGGGHEAAPSINWTDFADRHTAPIVALLVNFALLVTVLVLFGRKPLGEFLARRRRTIEEDLDRAAEEKHRAEGRVRGAEIRMKGLDDELMHLREDLLRVGHDERDRIIADAGMRAEKIRREAEFAAAEQERAAVRALRARAVDQAVEGAQRTLREKLTPQDHARLADAFLRRMEQGAGPR